MIEELCDEGYFIRMPVWFIAKRPFLIAPSDSNPFSVFLAAFRL